MQFCCSLLSFIALPLRELSKEIWQLLSPTYAMLKLSAFVIVFQFFWCRLAKKKVSFENVKFCLTGCYKEYIKISTTHRSIFKGSPQGGNVIDGTPHFSNQTLVGHIKTALVQDVINGLHLLHLDDPGVDRFRSFDQDLLQVVLCPMENLQRVGDCDIIITAKRQEKKK